MPGPATKRQDGQVRFFSPTSYIAFLFVLCLATSITFIANRTVQEHGDLPRRTAASDMDHGLRDTQDRLQSDSALLSNDQPSQRHRVENARLHTRLLRDNGEWGPSHPRYRLLEALFAYMQYRERNMAELERWRGLYKNVSKKQKRLLESVVGYEKKLHDIESLISANQEICEAIVAHALDVYGIEKEELDNHIGEAKKNKRSADKVSVSQTLKHFVRDWAAEGTHERDDAFPCILSAIDGLQIGHPASTAPVRVLIPGSGLGRLAHEIAKLDGYEVTVNEWSMYMNVAYRYIISRPEIDSISFHPFVDSLSHHLTTEDLLRSVKAPEAKPEPSVLLVEGDFTTVFSKQQGEYDVIVTHFFIDTARNLLSYFDTIHRLLKHGGFWINFGPLLYGTAPFVQLSLDEVVAVVENMGFEFEEIDERCGNISLVEKKVRWKEAEYGFNRKALNRNVYKAQAWVARKV